jgi:CBS domain-containing protein
MEVHEEVKAMKRVGEVMSHHVVTVRPETTYKEVARLLHRSHLTGVPVVNDDGEILGVISERDLLLKEEHGGLRASTPSRWRGRSYAGAAAPWWLQRQKARATVASELMTAPAVTIGPDATTAEAARVMRESAVRRLLVVDPDGRLVGIVTPTDLVRTFLRSDSRIRDDVEGALAVDVVSRVGFDVDDVPPEPAVVAHEAASFADTWRSPVS